jgi:hypothetical protein
VDWLERLRFHTPGQQKLSFELRIKELLTFLTGAIVLIVGTFKTSWGGGHGRDFVLLEREVAVCCLLLNHEILRNSILSPIYNCNPKPESI